MEDKSNKEKKKQQHENGKTILKRQKCTSEQHEAIYKTFSPEIEMHESSINSWNTTHIKIKSHKNSPLHNDHYSFWKSE